MLCKEKHLSNLSTVRFSNVNLRVILFVSLLLAALCAASVYAYNGWHSDKTYKPVLSSKDNVSNDTKTSESHISNPLYGKQLYIDQQNEIVALVNNKKNEGNLLDAELLNKIASQPQTLWLTGPTLQDPTATKDINLITRTSSEANKQNKLPLYKLYAIPNRDACGGYSKNAQINNKAYLQWVDTMLANLHSDAIFLIEADAIAHAVQEDCMNKQQVEERYELLNQVSTKLGGHQKVVAAYLDASHSEWFPDSDLLVEPLKKAGVDKIRGVVVNVSFFLPIDVIQPWTEGLVLKLGDNKAAIIDTSRNGKGTPPASVNGEDRWCNPIGRGLGKNPTLNTGSQQIDAYLWVKRPGESDGACKNNPPPGQLSETIAKELANNAGE